MAGKIFKYLPKSTSFSIPNGNTNNIHRASFSGPIVSIIPREARRQSKKYGGGSNDGNFEAQEPTSPKVTCIGQVKRHKNHNKSKKVKKSKEGGKESKEHQSRKPGMWGMFQKKVKPGRPPAVKATAEVAPGVGMMRRCVSGRESLGEVVVPEVPMMRKFASGRETLGEVVESEVPMMRKFASGRETLGDFDWRKFAVEEEEEEVTLAHSAPGMGMMRRCVSGRERLGEVVVPEVPMMRKFASGRETLGDFDWRKFAVEEEEEEEVVIVAHSAPLAMGGGERVAEVEKRKEVNLWKRRTLAPPEHIKLVF